MSPEGYYRLPPGAPLLACLRCGLVVPDEPTSDPDLVSPQALHEAFHQLLEGR